MRIKYINEYLHSVKMQSPQSSLETQITREQSSGLFFFRYIGFREQREDEEGSLDLFSLYAECENNMYGTSVCILRAVGQEKRLQVMQSGSHSRETQSSVYFSLQHALIQVTRGVWKGKGKKMTQASSTYASSGSQLGVGKGFPK